MLAPALGIIDPNLFHLDWDRTFEVLATIVVLSFLVERSLAVIFENKFVAPKVVGKEIRSWIAESTRHTARSNQ